VSGSNTTGPGRGKRFGSIEERGQVPLREVIGVRVIRESS